MDRERVTWLHEWPREGPARFRIGRLGDRLIAEWPGVGTLRTDIAGEQAEFTSENSRVPTEAREHMAITVAGLLRQLNGGIALHASAVSRDDVAVAWLGETGAGKSTMAAKVCAAAGAGLVADDTTSLRLDGPRIGLDAGERFHWLRTDVASAMGLPTYGSAKTPLRAVSPAEGTPRLAALVRLVFDADQPQPELTRLRGAGAFVALSLSTFRIALDVPHVLHRELDNLARIVREVPVYELKRRQDPRAMDACMQVAMGFLNRIWKGSSQ